MVSSDSSKPSLAKEKRMGSELLLGVLLGIALATWHRKRS